MKGALKPLKNKREPTPGPTLADDISYLVSKERRTYLKDIKRAFPMGSAPPAGYVDWHNWAEAQDAHGLKQKQCARCNLWIFPQEKPSHMTCEVSK